MSDTRCNIAIFNIGMQGKMVQGRNTSPSIMSDNKPFIENMINSLAQ